MPSININSGGGAGIPPQSKIDISAQKAAQMEYGLRTMLNSKEAERQVKALNDTLNATATAARNAAKAMRDRERLEEKGMRWAASIDQNKTRMAEREERKRAKLSADRFNQEVQGSEQAYRIEQAAQRKKEQEARRAQREEEKRLNESRRWRRGLAASIGGGGVIGGVAGNAAAGNVGGTIGSIAGAALGGIGFALGGPIGAEIGAAIGAAAGALVNPVKGPYQAAHPLYDYEINSYALARSMGLGGDSIKSAFLPHAGQSLPWMQKLGVLPQDALAAIGNYGATPTGVPTELARALRETELSGAFSGLDPSVVDKFMGTGAKLGITSATGGGVEQFRSQFEDVFIKAGAQGFDKSTIAQSIDTSLKTMAAAGAVGINAASLAATYGSLTALGGAGNATGAIAANVAAGFSTLAGDVTQNKSAFTALQTILPSYGSLKTSSDVRRFLGASISASTPDSVINSIAALAKVNPVAAEVRAYGLLTGDPAQAAKLALQGAHNIMPGAVADMYAPEIVSRFAGIPIGQAQQYIAAQGAKPGLTQQNIIGTIRSAQDIAHRAGGGGHLYDFINRWDKSGIGDQLALTQEFGRAGIQPGQKINLQDPATLNKILPVLLAHGGNKVDAAQIRQAVQAASGPNIPEKAFAAYSNSGLGDLNEAAIAARTLVPALTAVSNLMGQFADALSKSDAAQNLASQKRYNPKAWGHTAP